MKQSNNQAHVHASTAHDTHPLTAKTIESHRAHRRSMHGCIAELIDNSIDAGATDIDVTISGDESGVVDGVVVADNGTGMNESTLYDSFTLGAQRTYSPSDIGKYGMGGTSSCLAKAERKATITCDGQGVYGRCYDMDVVRENNRWLTTKMDLPQAEEEWAAFGYGMKENTGTLIKLERFLKDEKASSVITKVSRELAEIYWERLDQGSLNIRINGEEVVGACPVGTHHRGVEKGARKPIQLNGEVVGHITEVSLINVPKSLLKVRVSEDQEKKSRRLEFKAGLYFFRNDRLVCGGVMKDPSSDWNAGPVRHPNLRFARIKVEFSPEHDELFGLTNDKASGAPGQALTDVITEAARSFYGIETARAKSLKDQEDAGKDDGVADAAIAMANKPTVMPKQKRGSRSPAKGKRGTGNVKKISSKGKSRGWIENFDIQPMGASSDPWREDVSERMIIFNRDNRFIRENFLNCGKEARMAIVRLAIAELASRREMEMEPEFEDVDGAADRLENYRLSVFKKLRAATY